MDRGPMNTEPWHEGDYGDRQVEAAHRVLVDIGQVLSGFRHAIVVVGGWVPDLLYLECSPMSDQASIEIDEGLSGRLRVMPSEY
jgi:hypothetical protein